MPQSLPHDRMINDNILKAYLSEVRCTSIADFPSSGAPDVIYGFLWITIQQFVWGSMTDVGSRLRACRDELRICIFMCLLSSIITPIWNDKLEPSLVETRRKLTRGRKTLGFLPASRHRYEPALTFDSFSGFVWLCNFVDLKCSTNNLEVKIKIDLKAIRKLALGSTNWWLMKRLM